MKSSQTFFSPLVVCFIAADGEDLVVDHLHPVEGQWQRQLDVVRGFEPGVRQAVEHFVAVIKCKQPIG